MAKKKPSVLLDKATMNLIVKKMAKGQNSKNKLNAGQLRECARLFIAATVELAEERQATLVEVVREQ